MRPRPVPSLPFRLSPAIPLLSRAVRANAAHGRARTEDFVRQTPKFSAPASAAHVSPYIPGIPPCPGPAHGPRKGAFL